MFRHDENLVLLVSWRDNGVASARFFNSLSTWHFAEIDKRKHQTMVQKSTLRGSSESIFRARENGGRRDLLAYVF